MRAYKEYQLRLAAEAADGNGDEASSASATRESETRLGIQQGVATEEVVFLV